MKDQQNQWQPIGTAPKGNPILIYSPRYGVCHVSWCEFVHREPGGGFRGDWTIVGDTGDGYGEIIPSDATHWVPEPEPPNLMSTETPTLAPTPITESLKCWNDDQRFEFIELEDAKRLERVLHALASALAGYQNSGSSAAAIEKHKALKAYRELMDMAGVPYTIATALLPQAPTNPTSASA